jgi:hypothetical protein
MSLEQFFHSMEASLLDLGRRLCRDRFAEARDEADRVGDELRRERAALRRCRDDMSQLRQLVRAHEARADLLASRVESYIYVRDGASAFDHALELDSIRRRLAEDREGLRRALRRERECMDSIRDLERRYDDIHDRLARR